MGSAFNEEENTMSLLNNKIAVVTGGSSGIGLATAKRFVEEGAYVFIAGRRQAELDKAVAEIGKNVTAVKADISKLDDLDRFYETVAKKGKIDVIFAGAAFVEKADDRHGDARAFRRDLQHQRPRHLFHRSKGAALLERWGFHHPRGVRREEQRLSGPQHLQRHQGGAAVICPHVDQRIQGSEDQDQRAEPRRGRHADVRRAVPVQRGRRRSQKADHCDDRLWRDWDALRRSLRQLCSSPRTKAATSPVSTFRSMAA